jgi:Family of unknown function (DUF5681)
MTVEEAGEAPVNQAPVEPIPVEPTVAVPYKTVMSSPNRKHSLLTPAMEARVKVQAERVKAREARKKAKQEKGKVSQEIASKLGSSYSKEELSSPMLNLSEGSNKLASPIHLDPLIPSLEPIVNVGHKWQPGESGNLAGRPKRRLSREAIEKVIFNAKNNLHDPETATKFEALCKKAYEMAMDSEELDLVLQAIEKFSLLADGKPVQETDPNAAANPMLVVNIGTRFNPAEQSIKGSFVP